jgi:hypothetical protein
MLLDCPASYIKGPNVMNKSECMRTRYAKSFKDQAQLDTMTFFKPQQPSHGPSGSLGSSILHAVLKPTVMRSMRFGLYRGLGTLLLLFFIKYISLP